MTHFLLIFVVLVAATIQQAPRLLAEGWPWILVALVILPISMRWPTTVRVAARSLPIAIAFAPLPGAHFSIFPAWQSVMTPERGREAQILVLVTWALFVAIGVGFAKLRNVIGARRHFGLSTGGQTREN